MGRWFERKMDQAASVLFRGNVLPRAEEFASIPGVEVLASTDRNPRALWSLKLRHPKWGEATLMALPDMPVPPSVLVEIAAGLSEGEREDVAAGTQALALVTEGRFKSVLRDRKAMLFFGRAVMGDEGVGVVDHMAEKMWSREKLDDELAHDADLDVSQVFTVHAVSDGEEEDGTPIVPWVHTHGLGPLGGFDFDILAPSAALVESGAWDMIRALAYAVLDGSIKPDSQNIEIIRNAPMSFVEVGEFHRLAAEEYTSLRENDEMHNSNRSVICEPRKKSLLGIGGAKRPRPSRFFQRDNFDGIIIAFTDTATELMEKRARATVGVLRGLLEEFKELELPAMVKLGLKTNAGPREHPWFSVVEIDDTHVTGVCENDPHDIPNLVRGQQGRWELHCLSDWMLMSPAGTIQPHDFSGARRIRENYDEVLRIMQEENE